LSAPVDPPVTVVIPAWDAYVGPGLLAAVASVQSQDGSTELIVVDNASVPPVPELPGVRVIRTDTRVTRGEARNRGLAAVTAPFVVFLDADDVLCEGALAMLVDGIGANPSASAFVMSIIDGRTGARHRSPRRIARRIAGWPPLFAMVNAAWSLLPVSGCAIMRAAQVRACGGFGDADAGEDWVLGVSLAFRGRIAFDERSALVYHVRTDSPGVGATSVRVLLGSARRVRERVATDKGIPSWARTLLPLIAMGQGLALLVVRPCVRFARAVLRAAGAGSVVSKGADD
jgi:glycosyltransferase involved in cell wall biosynthesis